MDTYRLPAVAALSGKYGDMFFHVIFIMTLKTVSVFCLQKLTKALKSFELKIGQIMG